MRSTDGVFSFPSSGFFLTYLYRTSFFSFPHTHSDQGETTPSANRLLQLSRSRISSRPHIDPSLIFFN